MPTPQTVLITGSSEGGIGDALAREFHRRGLRVFATARNLKKVEHLRPLGLDILTLDVTDSESIDAAVDAVRKETGGTLDFLVNNSGSGYTMPVLDTNLKTAKEMFDVNVFGLVEVTQKFAPLLIKAKGTIINISSVGGIVSPPFHGLYNSSKAALNSIGDNLRVELAPFDVKVITVLTGAVSTKFFDNKAPSSLPADSLYLPIAPKFESQSNGKEFSSSQSIDDYAKGVVANALKPHPNIWYWRGGMVWTVWLVTWFWHSFPDSIQAKSSGLDKLWKLRRASK